MALLPPPPPNIYKHIDEMTLEECLNKIHAFKLEIELLYGKLRDLEIQMGIHPTETPEIFKNLLIEKPFPQAITPNVMMRSYKVDGTLDREHYNTLHQIVDCHKFITMIESRISEMMSG